jgi:hypothetical protein
MSRLPGHRTPTTHPRLDDLRRVAFVAANPMLRSLFGVSESSIGGALREAGRDLDSLSVNTTRQSRKITTEHELRDLTRQPSNNNGRNQIED